MNYENFRKTDIIQHLAMRFGYSNYLELCTTTTGNYYRNIDRSSLQTVRRLMYRCPSSYDDGMPIDYRCEGDNIDSSLIKLRASQIPIDICLVDGFHTYTAARRDLREAFDLLQDGGILVVHDCLPPTLQSAAPSFIEGEWCGVAYQAFLDFVFNTKAADYCTVDCDYGCGVVVKNRTISFSNGGGLMDSITRLVEWRPYGKFQQDRDTVALWRHRSGDHEETYRFFDQNRKELLRLVAPREFVESFDFLPSRSK